MFLQGAAMTECLVTFRAGKRLLSSMGSLMSLQVAMSDECLVQFLMNVLSHIEQVKGLSPVWVLS